MKKIGLILLVLELADLTQSWPDFYYSPRGNGNESVTEINVTASITATSFNRSLPTIFLVHGYKNTHLKRALQYMKNQLNQYVKANVIMVDWKAGANPKVSFKDLLTNYNYDEAANNTRIVGKSIAQYITANNIDPTTVTCIGHSLGAHCCGFAGKSLANLGRISGIDPAGPQFEKKPATDRLDKSDALFVDCIFTTTTLSFDVPICQVNFYPDSLVAQKKCGLFAVARLSCNHAAGVWYYAESIDSSTCKFAATKCNSLDEYRNQQCLCNATSSNSVDTCSQQMGFFAKANLIGSFYLETRKDKPYCLS